jgi:starch phosphorylase
MECQHKVDMAFRDQEHWTRMSILNVARTGKFSSGRSIREYCENIWDARPIEARVKLASMELAR